MLFAADSRASFRGILLFATWMMVFFPHFLLGQLSDVPLSVYQSYNGQLSVAAGGNSFFRDNTSGSFTVSIPACPSGATPTVRAAFLNWFSRWEGFYDEQTPPTFDETVTLNINGATSTITADDSYVAKSLFEKVLVDGVLVGTDVDDITQHSLADVSTLVADNIFAGENNITVSGFSLPQPNDNSTNPEALTGNFGAGLLVVYECFEPGVDTTSVFVVAGNDFFWCGEEGENNGTEIYGEYSDVFCLNFVPDVSAERNVTMDGFFAGQSRIVPPIRGNRLFYLTDVSDNNPPPANPQGQEPASPSVVQSSSSFVGEFPPNTVWNPDLGKEWAVANDDLINLPQSHDYFCIQGWSNASNGSGPCGSLHMSLVAFTISDVNLAPVDLVAFEAVPEDKGVSLTWSTASELNNSHFIIERGWDGHSFRPIGRVAGIGTTDRWTEYRFSDQTVPVGRVYYRLRQVDFDGAFAFSPVVSVNIVSGPDLEVMGVFPNPFENWLQIETRIPWDLPVTVSLRDLSGRTVMTQTREGKFGTATFQLSTAGLPQGMYFYEVEVNGRVRSGKILK